MVNPELKTTNDPSKVALLFDYPYPALFDILTKITTAEIQGVDKSLFLYEISRSSDLGFEIKINKLKSKENPFLIVKFFLPYE